MSTAKKLELDHGRSASVAGDEAGETLEIRDPGGQIELRIRMTAEGPVVQLDGVKIQIRARETIEMQCKEFSVDASAALSLGSKGEMTVRSTGEMRLEATDDCVIRGKIIHLN